LQLKERVKERQFKVLSRLLSTIKDLQGKEVIFIRNFNFKAVENEGEFLRTAD